MTYFIHPTNTPAAVNFSKNPILLSWNIYPYTEQDQQFNTLLTIQVEIQTINALDKKTFALRPDVNGNVSIDIASVIDSYLSFEMPNIFKRGIVKMNQQQCKFSVQASLSNDYEQLAMTSKTWYTGIKGGLSLGNITATDWVNQHLLLNKHFLRFGMEGEQVQSTDKLVLVAFNKSFAGTDYSYPLSYRYRTKVFGQSWSTYTLINEGHYTKDGDMIGLVMDLAKIINATHHAIEIQVVMQVGNTNHVIAGETFYLRQTTHADSTIYYFNSLGGIHHLNLFEYSEKTFNYSKSSASLYDFEAWANKNLLKHQNLDYNLTETIQPKVQTSLLTQKQLDVLRDLYLNKGAYVLRNNRLVPINLKEDSFKLTELNGMYAVAFGFEESISNRVYTPDEYLTTWDSCPAPAYLYITQTKGNYLQLKWGLAIGQYSGKILIMNDAQTLTQEINLTGNSGIISVDVSAFNPTNLVAYYVQVHLYNVCDDGLSNPIEQRVQVLKIAMPILPTLLATTYMGAGFRQLNFQNVGSNLLANADLNNNPNQYALRLTTSIAPNTNTLSGSSLQGGQFSIGSGTTGSMIGSNSNAGTAYVSYAPPANFSGTDIITYYGYAYDQGNATLQSTKQTAKIYIQVGGNNGGGTSTGVQVVYVRWDVDYNAIFTNNGTIRPRSNYWAEGKVFFFSDPYGINPLNVTGLGITLLFTKKYVSDGSIFGTETFPASGYSVPIPQLQKINEDVEIDHYLESSNQYYIIL